MVVVGVPRDARGSRLADAYPLPQDSRKAELAASQPASPASQSVLRGTSLRAYVLHWTATLAFVLANKTPLSSIIQCVSP